MELSLLVIMYKRREKLINRYFTCKRDLESMDHLVLNCQFGRASRELVSSCLDIY